MPRDYKHTVSKKRRKERPVGSWASFVSGLMVGLFVALLVFVYGEQLRNIAGGGDAYGPDDAILADMDDHPEPAPAPAAAPKPRFDFYKLLPEMEVEVPPWQLEDSAADEPGFQRGTYILQAGSFRNDREADRVKAMLALQGISATIQRVILNGDDVWYRVNVGPLTERKDIKTMRARLMQNGIDPLVLRVSGTT